MPRHVLSDEDRQKGRETQRRNRDSRKMSAVRAQAIDDLYSVRSDDEWAQTLLRYLILMGSGTVQAEPARIRAANVALAYLLPKLRAQEPGIDGDTPININEELEAQVQDDHGDPWEPEESEDE